MAIANVGSLDRIVRFVVGAGVGSIPFLTSVEMSSVPGIVSMAVGGILIATSAISFCPLYAIIGVRTRPRD